MAARPNVNALLKQCLTDRGVAVTDFTTRIHALNYKYPLYQRPGNPMGVVMHNTDGLILLENLVGTWKNKEPSPPPSHLAIDQSGAVGFYVRLEYADRATENTNRHLSIEFQAVRFGDLTGPQMDTAAIIAAFAQVVYGVDLAIANSRADRGWAHHALFVDPKNPDGHRACPGDAIIGRKSDILTKAAAIVPLLAFEDEPAGRWDVRVDRWNWIYTFDPRGNVSWRDPYNNMTGTGTWENRGGRLVFTWHNSQTTESWDLPLKATDQLGRTRMKGVDYEVRARRI